MAELSLSIWLLAGIFFLVAFAYSSVGLGGGSSYTALLAIAGAGALTIPMISLTLNLIVTAVGSVNFIKNKHARIGLILPFLISSIPLAYVGGALQLPKTFFYWILLVSLIFIALRIYVWDHLSFKLETTARRKFIISLFTGAVLGLLAGIVGIGGGIYLVPLILILGLGTPKEAAACGAIFIFLNSASGLAARLQHNSINIMDFIPLIVAVIVGGLVGSWMGAAWLKPRTMEKILGGITILAIVFLTRKLFLL